MIDELKNERERLLSERSSPRLRSELRRRLQSITRDIYIIRSIARQGEEIYDVLVDGATVVNIEIPRNPQNGDAVFETRSVEEYLKARSSPASGSVASSRLVLRRSREESRRL
jgi:hypothetical protein